MAEVALTLRWAGTCLHPEALGVRGASWRPIQLPALFGVIRHPRHGVTLFDTGYSHRFNEATRPFPERLYRWVTPITLRSGESAVEQLARSGVAAASVRCIVLSHFHADHIAGARDFPNARFVATRAAWEAVRGRGAFASTARGFLPELLPRDFEQRTEFLERSHFRPPGIGGFDCSYDLFGDGSVRLFPLPGHARGQIGLLAKTPTRRRFLIADAAWTTDMLRARQPPRRILGVVFDNLAETADTLSRLSDLSVKEPDVDIIPSHCPHKQALEKEPEIPCTALT